MIKIDLITGFLGSGKTTFIKEYAKYLIESGEKICILENDYGAVNVDMVLLQDLLGDNCNLEMIVGGDGIEAHRRRFKTKLISMAMTGYTRVLVEPSGIYDVDEFFDVLYDEPLDNWYEAGSIIGIVDASRYLELSDTSRYLLMSEISWAGKILLSRVDCISDGTAELVDSVASDEMELNVVSAHDAKNDTCIGIIRDAEKFLNDTMETFGCSLRFSEDQILAKPFNELTSEDFSDIKNAGYRHATYTKLPVGDDKFTSLFYFDVSIPEVELKEKLTSLFKDPKAGHIIRIKGSARVSDSIQLEINATDKEMSLKPAVCSRDILIIIGEGLDKSYINDIWMDYCSIVSL
ncbi:GTP-binding protein [Butyrivibrio sp. AE2032]|uniref:GTP-binding protein n=1 Tax=Butyrivibrio sp. AE2032 TaxID=1458463 RepID=UPI0006912EA7|nr:GTP-binding protein [Butyrivibrio sp. AE2032]